MAVHGVAVASLVLAFHSTWTPVDVEDGAPQIVAAQFEPRTDRSILDEPAEDETFELPQVDDPLPELEPIPLEDYSEMIEDPFSDVRGLGQTLLLPPDLDPERILQDPELPKKAAVQPVEAAAPTAPAPTDVQPDKSTEPSPAESPREVPEESPREAAPTDGPAADAVLSPTPLPNEYRPPAYPRLAERRGWTGTVVLLIDVAADGSVTDVTIESTSGHDILDEGAVTAV